MNEFRRVANGSRRAGLQSYAVASEGRDRMKQAFSCSWAFLARIKHQSDRLCKTILDPCERWSRRAKGMGPIAPPKGKGNIPALVERRITWKESILARSATGTAS